MKNAGLNMKYLFILCALFIFNASHAAEKIEIVAAEGSVMAGDEAGKMTKSVQTSLVGKCIVHRAGCSCCGKGWCQRIYCDGQ